MVSLEDSLVQLQGTLTLLRTRVWPSHGKKRHYMITCLTLRSTFPGQRWFSLG
ncbi:hypothetical protein Leryth_017286 [Lithospermum erythrorhizon]|nr:hypothetical protein Leryth_017286 [Lithospermum erythrorhizon]